MLSKTEMWNSLLAYWSSLHNSPMLVFKQKEYSKYINLQSIIYCVVMHLILHHMTLFLNTKKSYTIDTAKRELLERKSNPVTPSIGLALFLRQLECWSKNHFSLNFDEYIKIKWKMVTKLYCFQTMFFFSW